MHKLKLHPWENDEFFKKMWDLPEGFGDDVPDKIINMKKTTTLQEKKHAWSLDEDAFRATNVYYEEYKSKES